MKINFKHLLIIFLVALLGGAVGSLGINTVLNGTDTFGEDKPLVVNQLNYDNKYNNDYSSAINKAYETVVEINSTKSSTSFYFGRSESTSAGSGVIISDDGYIVTNHHVIKDANKITVKLNSGETFEAKLIGGDSRSDLALIKIDVNNLHYSNFADSDGLQMGDSVIAIGNPLGEGITASTGIISSLEKEDWGKKAEVTYAYTNNEILKVNSNFELKTKVKISADAYQTLEKDGNYIKLQGVVKLTEANTYTSGDSWPYLNKDAFKKGEDGNYYADAVIEFKDKTAAQLMEIDFEIVGVGFKGDVTFGDVSVTNKATVYESVLYSGNEIKTQDVDFSNLKTEDWGDGKKTVTYAYTNDVERITTENFKVKVKVGISAADYQTLESDGNYIKLQGVVKLTEANTYTAFRYFMWVISMYLCMIL